MTIVERLHRHGILRRGSKTSGFRYVRARSGRPVALDSRIKALRLPPAWREVAINSSAAASLQAIGQDAAGRWQYVYHARHVRRRERMKFTRLVHFGKALPGLRAAVARDLRRRDLGQDEVLATVVKILSYAFIRPGSEVYAAENGTYGLATLRRKHVRVKGAVVYFEFNAKSGKRQQCRLCDRQAARIIRKLLRLPGHEVFKYVDAQGKVVDVRSRDINAYIHRNMGEAFSAKDFRTWTATLICSHVLAGVAPSATSANVRRRCVVAAIKETAKQLGNTPAVCRASYISPVVLSAFERGRVAGGSAASIEQLLASTTRLRRSERALLRLLQAGM